MRLCLITILIAYSCIYAKADDSTNVRKHEIGVSIFSIRFTNGTYHDWLFDPKTTFKTINAIQYRKQFTDKAHLRVCIDYLQYSLNQHSYYAGFRSVVIQEPDFSEKSLGISIGVQQSFRVRPDGSLYTFIDVLQRFSRYQQEGIIEESYFGFDKYLVDYTAEGTIQEFGASVGFGLRQNITQRIGLSAETSFDVVYSKKENTYDGSINYLTNPVFQPISRVVLFYKF